MRYLVLLLLTVQLTATIIKTKPTKPVEVTYDELICEQTDKDKIQIIIHDMATLGLWKLLRERAYYDQLGADINRVHPLKFFAVILTDPTLKTHLQAVILEDLKWDEFMKGLSKKMDLEMKRNRMNPYLEPFAKEVGVEPASIQHYFASQDWDGLARYLAYGN